MKLGSPITSRAPEGGRGEADLGKGLRLRDRTISRWRRRLSAIAAFLAASVVLTTFWALLLWEMTR